MIKTKLIRPRTYIFHLKYSETGKRKLNMDLMKNYPKRVIDDFKSRLDKGEPLYDYTIKLDEALNEFIKTDLPYEDQLIDIKYVMVPCEGFLEESALVIYKDL